MTPIDDSLLAINEITRRLWEDLVGPTAEREVIGEWPTDRYVTGMLYPTRTEHQEGDDERLALSEAGDEQGAAREDAALRNVMRPSAAGVSFAARASGRARPTATFVLECATYAVPQAVAEAAGPATRVRFERVPHRLELHQVDLATCSINLAEHGLYGVELSLDVSAWQGGVLVTVVVVNRREIPRGSGRTAMEESTLFQVRLACSPGAGTVFPARPSVLGGVDADAEMGRLIYREARTYAVGHTCSAEWQLEPVTRDAREIATTWMPRASVLAVSSAGSRHLEGMSARTLEAQWLGSAARQDLIAALKELPASYEAWIGEQAQRVTLLQPDLRVQAERHIEACRGCSSRMEAAIRRLDTDAQVREAFQFANRAMVLQRHWAYPDERPLRWFPFQLGFLLLALESVADASHPDRSTMDLLWFPTGGGKTEAYLALVAFTIAIRRLRSGDGGGGVATFMRYTLRLLTTQQFQRAAALILACDLLRRETPHLIEQMGHASISIGLWVGGDAVANEVEEALGALESGGDNRPDQLERCPACDTLLRWQAGPRRRSVEVSCPGERCPLGNGALPIWTVDEDVYRELPSLLIGTVDKYALVARKAEVGRLFGKSTQFPAPDLIIQDELHLISGPLGTLAGLYETAIDHLCRDINGANPKVVGSTATIRRAAPQIRALFDREGQLFPPPGLDANDSCFSVPDHSRAGRQYLAVTTAGRSAKFTLQAVMASLMQSAAAMREAGVPVDPYWTAVGYFNALRELGGALVMMQDDVPSTIRQLATRRGERERSVHNLAELTSRVGQAELKERLEELKRPAGEAVAVDALLATNMISVGVDIQRLALMVVMGQPKASAEYIQATSRVGRGAAPGLVVAIYNHAKARDRSRYEAFTGWHDTLYREVEATSVTPFSSRARDRALHAVLVALVRHTLHGMTSHPTLAEGADLSSIFEEIVGRCRRVSPEEGDATYDQLEQLAAKWVERGALRYYWNDFKPGESLLLSAEAAAARRATGRESWDAWATPNSMRNVEPSTGVAIIERLREE